MVNHGDKAKHRNATMKIVDETAMALYATRSITAGEQILYDYGVQVPWTGQVYYYPSFYLTTKTLFSLQQSSVDALVIMVALWNRADHYIFVL